MALLRWEALVQGRSSKHCRAYKAETRLQVLVHAGTGGVGLSAVQVSKAVGAAVVATAGSASKRKMLRDMGVATAVGSRDTEFATTLAPSGVAWRLFA